MATTETGVIQAFLSQVGYDGENNGCSDWSGLIEFEVLPNGDLIPPLPFQNLHVKFGEPPATPDLPVYHGPGGYHGSFTPEAILNVRISVWGQAGGQTIQGTMAAVIPHPGTDTIHPAPSYCVVVPVLPRPVPPPPPPPDPARLWFNFTVGTVC